MALHRLCDRYRRRSVLGHSTILAASPRDNTQYKFSTKLSARKDSSASQPSRGNRNCSYPQACPQSCSWTRRSRALLLRHTIQAALDRARIQAPLDRSRRPVGERLSLHGLLESVLEQRLHVDMVEEPAVDLSECIGNPG